MLNLITKIGQQPEELVFENGAVLVFVVQLQDLDEVVEAAGVLESLACLKSG